MREARRATCDLDHRRVLRSGFSNSWGALIGWCCHGRAGRVFQRATAAPIAICSNLQAAVPECEDVQEFVENSVDLRAGIVAGCDRDGRVEVATREWTITGGCSGPFMILRLHNPTDRASRREPHTSNSSGERVAAPFDDL